MLTGLSQVGILYSKTYLPAPNTDGNNAWNLGSDDGR